MNTQLLYIFCKNIGGLLSIKAEGGGIQIFYTNLSFRGVKTIFWAKVVLKGRVPLSTYKIRNIFFCFIPLLLVRPSYPIALPPLFLLCSFNLKSQIKTLSEMINRFYSLWKIKIESGVQYNLNFTSKLSIWSVLYYLVLILSQTKIWT